MKSNCDSCKHGSRHLALNNDGNPIPKDWSKLDGLVQNAVDSAMFWTYFTCAKNMFSITTNCTKFNKKG